MKTALVTGGNKGIGFAVCRQLAEQGFRVFLGSRDDERGEAAVVQLHEAGYPQVELLVVDVADPVSVEAAAGELAGRANHLDALVNNAGVFLDDKVSPLAIEPEVIIETFQTNTLGSLLMTRTVLPLLKKAGEAEVVNVSSGMGQLSDMNGGSAAYRISKTALNAVTRILASELSPFRIRVNSVCPGWVKTDMGGPGATRTPDQGADTIAWLASGKGGKATGGFFRDRKPIPW